MPAIRSHHWPSSLSCSPPERPTERLALSRLLSKFATQPLNGHDAIRSRARMAELLDAVQMPPNTLTRYPHEFSGGQAQRIAIARALAAEAEVLILDEPVSALDVSVQAQVLLLLQELKQTFGLSYLFISHDLAVVEAVADRVAVMRAGRLVEEAPVGTLFSNPADPYTVQLLASAPRLKN